MRSIPPHSQCYSELPSARGDNGKSESTSFADGSVARIPCAVETLRSLKAIQAPLSILFVVSYYFLSRAVLALVSIEVF